jgi:hypothetical protein
MNWIPPPHPLPDLLELKKSGGEKGGEEKNGRTQLRI